MGHTLKSENSWRYAYLNVGKPGMALADKSPLKESRPFQSFRQGVIAFVFRGAERRLFHHSEEKEKNIYIFALDQIAQYV